MRYGHLKMNSCPPFARLIDWNELTFFLLFLLELLFKDPIPLGINETQRNVVTSELSIALAN